MTDDEKLIQSLQATRQGYEVEAELHQFLFDATSGGGGFCNGRVPVVDAPYWGRAARDYSRSWMSQFEALPIQWSASAQKNQAVTKCYLEAFYGEDKAQYQDRINTSVYSNPIKPIVNIVNSFLTADDAEREGLTPEMDQWTKGADALRRPLEQVTRVVSMRGQVAGYCFCVVDLPEGDQGPSLATSQPPCVSVFWPQQALDWDLRDGKLVAIKFCTPCEMPRQSMLEPKKQGLRYTLWYPDHWERYTLVEDDQGKPPIVVNPQAQQAPPKYVLAERAEGPNPIGRVPVSIFRWEPLLSDDPVRGGSQIATSAQLARDLYNVESERRHLQRQQAFSLLVVPGGPSGSDPGTQEVGAGNFSTEDKETNGITRYVSPSDGPFEALAKQVDERKHDIYDVSLIDRGQSRQQETAEARRLRFQRTNMMLSQAAKGLCEWEKDTLTLVGLYYRVPEDRLKQITVTRKDDYAIQQFAETLEQAIKSADLPLAPECLASVINTSVVDGLLSGLPDDERADLKEKNTAFIAERAKRLAASRSAPPAAPPPPPSEDDGKEEDGDPADKTTAPPAEDGARSNAS